MGCGCKKTQIVTPQVVQAPPAPQPVAPKTTTTVKK